MSGEKDSQKMKIMLFGRRPQAFVNSFFEYSLDWSVCPPLKNVRKIQDIKIFTNFSDTFNENSVYEQFTSNIVFNNKNEATSFLDALIAFKLPCLNVILSYVKNVFLKILRISILLFPLAIRLLLMLQLPLLLLLL